MNNSDKYKKLRAALDGLQAIEAFQAGGIKIDMVDNDDVDRSGWVLNLSALTVPVLWMGPGFHYQKEAKELEKRIVGVLKPILDEMAKYYQETLSKA